MKKLFQMTKISMLCFVAIGVMTQTTTVKAEDYILGRPMTEEEIQYQESLEPEYMPELPSVPSNLFTFEEEKGAGWNWHDLPLDTAPADLPKKYDLRTLGLVSPARHQGSYGTCWAFASLGSMESNLIKNGQATSSVDLSETHLSYYAYHQGSDALRNTVDDIVTYYDNGDGLEYLRNGGNYMYSSVALLNGKGAANESTWGYYGYSNATMSTLTKALSTNTDYAWTTNSYTAKNIYMGDATDFDTVKEMLMEYGALYTNMYFLQKDSTVYNASTAAYYNTGVTSTNHAVNIVGWDDNYSKSNFATTPPGDGAWICKNSWGESWGEKGYFYVSYYDSSINKDTVVAFAGEAYDSAENLYYYGGGNSLYFASKANGVAQVIKASACTEGKEKVESVGLFIYDTTQYSLQLYLNPEMQGGVVIEPQSGEPLLNAPITGKISFPGYHTFDIYEDIVLNEGDVLTAVIKFDAARSVGVDKTTSYGIFMTVNSTAPGQTFMIGSKDKATDTASATNPYTVRMTITTEDVNDIPGGDAEDDIAKEYSIEYVLDGGENDERNPEKYTVGVGTALYPAKKTGYTFNKWCTDASLSYESRIAGISESDIGDFTLYAKYNVNKYSIAFDGNGSDAGAVATMSNCKYDATYVLPACDFVYNRHDFLGWNTEADGSGTMYQPKDKVKNLIADNNAVVTLYAQWNELQPAGKYNITYVMYDGENATENPEFYLAGEKIKLYAPTKVGYTFSRWCTDASLSYDSRITEIPATMSEDVTLYAKFNVNKYNIFFDGNGATAGSVSIMNGCKYDVSYALPENGYTKEGYDFLGWNVEPEGNGEMLQPGQKIKNLTSENNATITLYACWESNAPVIDDVVGYKITYVMHDGINNEQNPEQYEEGDRIVLQNPTKVGYTFSRWCTDESLSFASRITTITEDMSGDLTLYAKFNVNKYEIQFDGNGAESGLVASLTNCKYDTLYTMPQNTYVREGFIFAGWNDAPDGSGNTYKAGEKVKNLTSINGAVKVLYAQWDGYEPQEQTRYQITYILNGSVNADENPNSYAQGDYIKFGTPVKKGYIFSRWCLDVSLSFDSRITEINGEMQGNLTVYAKFNPIKYNVEFEGNGADMEAVYNLTGCKYDTAYALPKNILSREECDFVGWNTAADGSGAWYQAGEKVKNLSDVDGSTVVLYAQWR